MKTENRTVEGVIYENSHGLTHTIMVERCCWCGGSHRHITTDIAAEWAIRHPCCRPRRAYLIRISAA